jgi:5'-nucleotidase
VSNDDGFFSDGIKTLAARLRDLGEVWVVAPDREQSASGHSLTLHKPLRVRRASKSYPNVYMVDGTPTHCVNLVINKLMPKKPDIVISGINHGANLGDDVTYSGTVSAALEAVLLGLPAIAVSAIPHPETDEYSFEPAAEFAAFLAKKVLENGLAAGTLLNVNVPAETKLGETRSVVTRMGKRVYSDVVAEKVDPRGRTYYWVGGSKVGSQVDPGTDCEAADRNRISVTPVQLDMTNYTFLSKLPHWNLPGYE